VTDAVDPPAGGVTDPYDRDAPAEEPSRAPDVPGEPRYLRTPAEDQLPPPDELRRLWAPWRFAYISSGAPIEGCPFCVLPDRGTGRDRESLIVHRGEHAYVILNAYPYNPGHLMVCPFAHESELSALDAPAAQELWKLGRRAAEVLRDRLSCEGINLGMNLGAAAGAGVADHLHLHVVPRWTADTNFISVVGAARVLPRSLAETYDELAPAFRD
jgi:ATP adenylyltransferase